MTIFKKICFSIFGLLLFPVISLAGQDSTLDLSGCLNYAKANSLELQMQKARVEEAQGKYRFQLGMLLPQLDAGLSYYRYGEQLSGKRALFGASPDDYYADVSLKQVLFSGGKYFAQMQSARLALEAEQEKLELVSRSTALAVKKAYYEQARANFALKNQNTLVARLKEQTGIAQLLYNSGKTSNLDVLKIQTQLASAEDSLARLKDLAHTRALLLGQSMGQDEPVYADSNLHWPDESLPGVPDCNPQDLRENPEIRQAVKMTDKAKKDADAAGAELYPNLLIKVNYNFEDKDFFPGHDNWYAGVGLTLPLFHGGSVLARISQAQARVKQAETRQRQVELSLKVRMTAAMATAVDKRKRLATSRKVAQLSREALNAAELKYNAGKLTAMELLDAQTVWNDALQNEADNTLDYLVTLAEIEYLCPSPVLEEEKP